MPYPESGATQDGINADLDTRVHALEIFPPSADAARIEALEEADEVLHEQVAGIETSLMVTKADVGALTDKVNAQATQVLSLSAATGEALAALGTDLDAAEASVTVVEQKVNATQSFANGTSGRVDSLVTSVNAINLTATSAGSTADAAFSQAVTASSRVDAQQSAINGLTTRLATIEGAQTSGWPGHVLVTSFAGATTHKKMEAALAYVAAASDGRKPAIILPPGFNLSELPNPEEPLMIPSGAAIIGGVVPQTEFSPNARVTISGAAPNGYFGHGVDARSITIANIGWEGPGKSQVCRFMAEENKLCYSLFSGVSFDNFTSVLRKRFLGFLWEGMGYTNNCSETPFEFSGSDYKVFMSGYYLDSPHLKDTDYLLHIKSGNKVTVGEMFITGDGPTPVRVSAGQMVRLRGLEMEAEGVPRKTAGAGLLVTGGNVIVDNAWFFRTMDNPTALGHQGVIHVQGSGTLVRVKNATFGEYSTNHTTEKPGGYTENHVYAAGSARVYLDCCMVVNMQNASAAGGYAGARPLQVAKTGTAQIHQSTYAAVV